KRWECLLRLDAAGRNLLRDGQNADRGEVEVLSLARVDVRQRRIRRAQVDADFHFWPTFSLTLNSSFHLRPSLATHQSCSTPVSVTTVSSDTGTSWPAPSAAGRSTCIGDSSSSSSR